jgi:hypothetical protein
MSARGVERVRADGTPGSEVHQGHTPSVGERAVLALSILVKPPMSLPAREDLLKGDIWEGQITVMSSVRAYDRALLDWPTFPL